MTLRPALARLKRGFLRLWGRAVAWVRDPLGKRRTVTEGHQVNAQETATMLGLMADANAAGADMTDEQRLLLIQAAPGMRAREAVLLGIPNRSLVEENELHMIRREMARMEGRTAPVGPRRFFAAPALLGGLQPWMIWTGAVVLLLGALGIQTGRLESAKANLREARAEAQQAHEAAESWRERTEQYAQAVTDARETARMSAEALTAEREARARAARAERRRQREIQDVLANSPEPPAWSLRDDGTSTQ